MEARKLILTADAIAREKGITQSQWSRNAGYASNGQTVSRIINKGDCRISTFVALLRALGCTLEINTNDEDENINAIIANNTCNIAGNKL